MKTLGKSLFKQMAGFAVGASVALSGATVMAQTIKIGTPLALTGGLADEGKKQVIAYDMWLNRVNAAVSMWAASE